MEKRPVRSTIIGAVALIALLCAGLFPAAAPAVQAASSIRLSSTASAPGTNVTVTGLGFTPLDTAVVMADFTVGGTVKRVQTAVKVDQNGAFVTSLTVPAGTEARDYTVGARDFHSHSASAPLTVLPEVLLQVGAKPPTATVQAGHRFVARGAGFQAGEPVNLTATFPLYNGNSVNVSKTATADKNGNFGGLLIPVPAAAKAGTVKLTAAGQTSKKTSTANIAVVYRPFLVLNPKVVRPGAAVTVLGHRFVPGSRVHVSITIGRTGATTVTLGQDVTADANGAFSASITIPANTKPGNYPITAVDATGGFKTSAPLTVAIKPTITVQPTPALPGETVKVSGGGYSAGVQVTVSVTFLLRSRANRTVTANAQTNANGAFTTTLTVPNGSSSQKVTVRAAGPNGQATTALSVGQRTGKASVTPSPASPGQTVTVTGTGFSPGVSVTVSAPFPIFGGGSKNVSTTVKANGKGQFSTGLTIPRNAAAGGVIVTAQGPNAQANAQLRIRRLGAAISTTPASVIPGSAVTVKGSGYLAGDTITVTAPITLSNGARQTLSATATTNAQGQFTATLHVPAAVAGGTYTVTGKSASTGRAPTSHFAVAKLAPSIVAVPTTAVPGTQVTVNGFGFAAGERVNVALGSQAVGSATTSPAGKFSLKVTVPGATASGTYPVTAASSTGRRASVNLTVNRQVSTHYYFAAFYTGHGYHEYIAFLNPSAIRARVTITYELTNGTNRAKTISINPHSRFTEDVNADVGVHVSAGASIAADVPIAAERVVYHGVDGAVVPGRAGLATSWYFANGNTNKGYREYVAVLNPNTGPVQVAVHIFPTHHPALTVYRTLPPTTRKTFHINTYVKDAVGVTVTANGPVVANRTIFAKHGMTSKMGAISPHRTWYFAAGPRNSLARHWIGAINPSNQRSYVTLRAYGLVGRQLGTVKGWLKPHARVGYLLNKIAHRTDVAVVLSASRPIVAEQTTYVGRLHNASTDTFGVPDAATSWAFAAVNTSAGDADVLDLFNPNLVPVPIVVQYMTASGATSQQTFVVRPLNHQVVDVGSAHPNAQLGIVAASNYPFVALNRIFFNNRLGSDTSPGVHLP